MTRVLICGNSGWDEKEPIRAVLKYWIAKAERESFGLAFISGMAPGADWIAWQEADALDAYCDHYPWNAYGRAKARYNNNGRKPHRMRNQWMLDSGVDVNYAYAYDIRTSIGTRDMVSRTCTAGVPTYWYDGYVYRKLTGFVTENLNIDALEVMPWG